MSGGECQTCNTKDYDGEEDEKPTQALDDVDIALLKSYGRGPYTDAIKDTEDEIKKHQDKVQDALMNEGPRYCCVFRTSASLTISSRLPM